MSNIEPTEEQRAAAATLVFGETWPAFRSTAVARWVKAGVEDDGIDLCGADEIAQLLAEREAKLREDVDANIRLRVAAEDRTRLLQGLANTARAEADTLRARVAELEAKAANLDARLWDRCEDLARVGLERVHADAVHSKREAQHLARIAELEASQGDTVGCEGCGKRLPSMCAVSTEDPVYLCARCVSPMHMEREAQHLADIKALMEALKGFLVPAALTIEFNPGVRARALLQRLAHYDDAKAAAPECPKCQEGTHPFYDVEQSRWLCDRCHHPAGEPFVHDAEGGAR